MQKNRNTTIFILIILCMYFLFSQFYLKSLGNLYTYIINPLFFVAFSIALKFIIISPYKTNKYKKTTIQYVIVTTLTYSILLLISGLFLTYGKNPYSTTFKGVMLNLYAIGLIVICREYIRYKLINNVLKKEQKLIFILIVITFTLQDIDLVTLKNSLNIYYLFKTVFVTIVPSTIKNCLFTYICIYTDYMPGILYELILYLIQWVSPILPKTPWVFTSIIDSVFPLILLLYCRYEINSNNKFFLYKFSNPIEPKGTIPLVIGVVLVIWFALGIFPIKPIGVATGSMKPTINVGDLMIIQKCNANDIKVNDIIEYARKDYTVIHRVIDIYQEDGEFFFITKGDNNDSADSDPVRENQLKGKAIFRIPYLALPTIWIDSLSGRQSNVDVETGN